jgi:thiosulfate/3-mercaptopyruvate sulfurtransferase
MGKLTTHPSPDRVVTSDWLRTRLDDPKVDLLDARPPDLFSGTNPGEFPRSGHIPGARNVPLLSALQPDGTLKPSQSLREIMSPAGSPATAVSYCNTGQQATVLYFVGRYLGLDVRLYDGSMQEWTRQPNLPVESSPKLGAATPAASEMQPQL